MKKLVKLVLVLAVVMFTTNTFAEELGLKISNLNLAPAAKEKKNLQTEVHLRVKAPNKYP